MNQNQEQRMNCPWQKKCGACTYAGKSYEETLRDKEKSTSRLLRPFVNVSGITGMDDPWYYRNKVHRVCTYETRGRGERHLSGIYAEGTHKVVPVQNCLIEDKTAQEIMEDILRIMSEFRIRNYEEDARTGLLRHILIRRAHATGEVMAVLVLTSFELPGKKHIVERILQKRPEVSTIVINLNVRPGSVILGDREKIIYGKGYIEDELCGKRFRISARSFYQVNPVQTEKLYRKAIEFAALNGHQTVIDAYCGIGTIGIAAADMAGNVTGIESVREAVQDARINGKINGLKNIRFVCADAGAYLEKMAAEKKRADVIFMDPPRSGSTEAFMKAAAAVSPGRIVYVSCNPETLARDLGYFEKFGYTAIDAAVFDQFAWTRHIECVVLLQLSNRKPNAKFRMDVNLEDYYQIKEKQRSDS